MGCASGNFTEQWSHQRDHIGAGFSTHAGQTHSQPGLTACPMALEIMVQIVALYLQTFTLCIDVYRQSERSARSLQLFSSDRNLWDFYI